MHVTFLCEFGSLNGGEQSLLAVLPVLQSVGLRLTAIAPPQGPLGEAFRGLGVELIPWFDPERENFAAFSLAEKRERLAGLLAKHRCNLLHANSLSMGRLSGPVLAELGIPGISHIRDIVRLSRQAVCDLNRHARLLAVSEATRAYHLAQGVDADKCRTLYNGVDLAKFAPKPPNGFLHRELGIPPARPLLGTIGQIGPRKGQDVLLEALGPIVAPSTTESLEPHLLIIGSRFSEKEESLEFERRLKEKAAEPPFCGRVHFLGVRSDIPELLAELTLLVHPARQEPLGRVLLEASACGCPILASDVGGTAEILPNREMLFPPNDPGALREKLSAILQNTPLRKTWANASRKKAEHLFSVEQSAQKLIGVYSELV